MGRLEQRFSISLPLPNAMPKVPRRGRDHEQQKQQRHGHFTDRHHDQQTEHQRHDVAETALAREIPG